MLRRLFPLNYSFKKQFNIFPISLQYNYNNNLSFLYLNKRLLSNKQDNYNILKTLIETYRLSYEKGEYLISDHEYDKLYQELLDIERDNPHFCDNTSPTQQVAPLLNNNDSNKKKHYLPMLGLQNAYNDEQLYKFEKRIIKEISSRNVNTIPIEYITEMKYDGMAISLLFKKGILQYAISRGDGIYGEDITYNFLKYTNNLPFIQNNSLKTLQVPINNDIVEIRGEILCKTKEFNKINKQKEELGEKTFSTPRNVATGCLSKTLGSNIDIDISLDMVCYSLHIYKDNINTDEQTVIWSDKQPLTQWDSLQLLNSWNYPTCLRAQKYIKFKDTLDYIHKYEKKDIQDKFPFTTDGVAIKINSIEQQLALGRIARSYKWAIAYKFPTDSYITKLLDIKFQIGRTRKATPVAYLEKILIDGSNVSRATLHNVQFMEQHKIEIGDLVTVEKSGGTIPKISGLANPQEKKDKNIPLPIELICPCDKKVPLIKYDEYVDVFCSSTDCKEQKIRTILHFAKSLSIIGLGEAVVKVLLQENIVNNVFDIFTLQDKQEELLQLPRWGEKKVSNLLNNIEKAKQKASLSKLLFALAIPNVGDAICKQLEKKYKTLDNLTSQTSTDLMNDKFSQIVATNLSNFFSNNTNKKLLLKLSKTGFNV